MEKIRIIKKTFTIKRRKFFFFIWRFKIKILIKIGHLKKKKNKENQSPTVEIPKLSGVIYWSNNHLIHK